MVMVLRSWLIGMNEESPVNFRTRGGMPPPIHAKLPKTSKYRTPDGVRITSGQDLSVLGHSFSQGIFFPSYPKQHSFCSFL